MKGTFQGTTPAALLENGADLIQKPSAKPARQPDSILTPKAKPLTALVHQVQPSQRWETAAWVALGFASLVILGLVF